MLPPYLLLALVALAASSCGGKAVWEYPRPLMIRIRVLDEKGSPAAGCTVGAEHPISSMTVGATTDENGMAVVELKYRHPKAIQFSIWDQDHLRGILSVDLPKEALTMIVEAQFGYYCEYTDKGVLREKQLDAELLR